MADQNRADALQERLIDFAVQIISLTSVLPRTSAGRHLAKQLLRSGTAPAPNYGEARGGESRSDFAHKLGIVAKELNETKIWLQMIFRAKLVTAQRLSWLLNENEQLCRIIHASIRTTRAKFPDSSGAQRQIENSK